MSAKVKYNQVLLDIAMQETGTVETLFTCAALNGIGITDQLAIGTTLLTPAPDQTKKRIVQIFTNPALAPASGDDDIKSLLGGIGYMQIGRNFRVS